MSDQQISNTTPIPFSDNQEQQKQQFSNNGSLSTASSGFLQLGDKDRPTRVSFHNLVAAPTPAPAPEVRRTAITLNTAPTVATLKAQESAIESQRQKQDEVTSAFVTSPIPAYATSDRQASDAEIIASDKPQQQQGERPSSVALTDQRMFSDEEDDHEEEELKNEQVAHQSQASLTSNNVITARIMKAIEKNISDYLDSPFMTNVYIFSEKIKVRVVFWLLVNYVLIGAAIVISYKLTNVTVPGMWVYNLLHVLLSLLTLLVVQTVEVFSYEVSTAILGSQLIHGKAVLSELTKNSIYRDPAAGRKIRYFLWFLSLGFEGVVTWLCVQLEWTPEPSTLGIQPCTPATYPTAPALLPDFGNYIQGDMEFALIYNYALPLADGVIGGNKEDIILICRLTFLSLFVIKAGHLGLFGLPLRPLVFLIKALCTPLK